MASSASKTFEFLRSILHTFEVRKIPKNIVMNIRTFFTFLLATPVFAATALAQAPYPNKPITMVVPFGAGSGTDVVARLLAEKMGQAMNTSIIIDNKPGATGILGAEFVARAKPDGYTLLVGTNSTNSTNQFLFKNLRYDPVKSFSPVGLMTINPQAFLVRSESPFQTVEELMKYGHENPEKMSFGYGNTTVQVAGAMLATMGKVDALRVPYKSSPQVFTDLIGGQIDFTFSDFAASRSLIDSGKLRALAVTTPKRFPLLPNVPAMSEVAGLEDFSIYAWIGLLAPANTPDDIVSRLNLELRNALELPEIRNRLENVSGSIVEVMSVEQYSRFLNDQSELWQQRINEAGIKPE